MTNTQDNYFDGILEIVQEVIDETFPGLENVRERELAQEIAGGMEHAFKPQKAIELWAAAPYEWRREASEAARSDHRLVYESPDLEFYDLMTDRAYWLLYVIAFELIEKRVQKYPDWWQEVPETFSIEDVQEVAGQNTAELGRLLTNLIVEGFLEDSKAEDGTPLLTKIA